MEEVTLTFDPTGFMEGLNRVNQKLNNVQSNLQKTEEKKSKATSDSGGSSGGGGGGGVKGLLGGLGKIAAILGPIIGFFSAMMKYIPEIGKTFKIVSEIFFKNFFMPLRRALLPLLQSLLNWVRDNRAMFVRWGQIVANIFHGIVNIVKSLWKVIKDLWDQLFTGIQKIFGKTSATISQVANLVIFKITAVVQFLIMTLKPVFASIIEKFQQALEYAKSFYNGLKEGLGDVTPDLNSMWESIKKIWNIFSNLGGDGDGGIINVSKAFKTFGQVLGTIVRAGIVSVASSLSLLAFTLETVTLKWRKFQAWRNDNEAEGRRIDRIEDRVQEKFMSDMKKRWTNLGSHIKETATGIWDSYSDDEENNESNTDGQISFRRSSSQGANQVNNNDRRSQNRTTNNNQNNQIRVAVNVSGSQGGTDSFFREGGRNVGNEIGNVLQEQRFRAGA